MESTMELEIGAAGSHGITHPKKRAMLLALAKTGNISAAARAAGIGRKTHYDWLASDLSYAPAVQQAMEEAADVLEAVARKRAIVGSDTLLIFLLKSIRPEKFSQRVAVTHEPAPHPAMSIPREDLQGALAERLDRLPIPAARLLHRALEARLARRPDTLAGEFTLSEEN